MADRRIITKSDPSGADAADASERELRLLNAGIHVLRGKHGDISTDELFRLSLVNPETGKANLDRWLNPSAHRDDHSDSHDCHIHNHAESDIHFGGRHGQDMGPDSLKSCVRLLHRNTAA